MVSNNLLPNKSDMLDVMAQSNHFFESKTNMVSNFQNSHRELQDELLSDSSLSEDVFTPYKEPESQEF